jgi:hypothetical protein
VSVAAGPSYTTKRQEAVEAMMQLTQNAPQFLQVAGDIMVRNMDWPGAQEIADRLKKMLPPPLQDENDDESPAVQAVKAQASQVIQGLQQQLEEMNAAGAKIAQENQDLKQKFIVDMADVKVKAFEAVTERMQALAPAFDPEQVKFVVSEAVAAIMAQPAPMDPMQMQPMQPPPPQMQPQQPPPGGFSFPGA